LGLAVFLAYAVPRMHNAVLANVRIIQPDSWLLIVVSSTLSVVCASMIALGLLVKPAASPTVAAPDDKAADRP
ncbi:MAG: hypothetical protein AAGH64_07905, partial [Planctomycetota bacterium]